jgi:hypothetical protein
VPDTLHIEIVKPVDRFSQPRDVPADFVAGILVQDGGVRERDGQITAAGLERPSPRF